MSRKLETGLARPDVRQGVRAVPGSAGVGSRRAGGWLSGLPVTLLVAGALGLSLLGCGNRAQKEGDAFFQTTDFAAAAKRYEPLVAQGKASLEVRRRYVISLARSGQVDKAASLLESLMKEAPDAELAGCWIDALALTKGATQAAPVAEQLMKQYPQAPPVLRAMGTLKAQRGEVAEARKLLQEALDRDPQLAAAHMNLADLDLLQGELVRAMERYQKALSLEPRSPMSVRIRVRMAQISAESRPDEAMKILQEALGVEPQAPDALAELGKLSAAMGLYDDGVTYLKEAYEAGFERPDVLSTLGFCYLQRGANAADEGTRHQELLAAKMWLNRLLVKAPTYRGARVNLGNVLAQLGDAEAAEQEYRKELTVYPSSVEAQANLGRYLAEQGRLEEAISMLQKGFEVDRQEVMLASELGRLNVLQNRWEEGVKWYREALTLCEQSAVDHPCRREVPYQLARASARSGDKKATVEWILKSMEAGFQDWGRLAAEPELRFLQAEPRVQQFIRPTAGAAVEEK